MIVMRKNIISAILLVLLFSLRTAEAQTSGGKLTLDNLTLDEAIQWGVNNSPILLSNKLKLQKDEQELSRIRLSNIPDINLSGDLRRNLIIPTTPIPASIMNSAADPDQIVYMKFNTGWNSNCRD